MKTRLSITIALLTIIVLSGCVHAQTPIDARQVWSTAVERLAQRESTHRRAIAIATIERSIQRTGEEEPTIVTKATARIWKDDPKLGMPYSPTGIRRETITFDGHAVCQTRDMDGGARTGIDYGHDYALPLMFAGFPSPDPIRPWTYHISVARLPKREFEAEYLNSGMVRVQLKPAVARGPRSFVYLLPDSNECRRYEVEDSSGQRLSSVDLTWGEFNGTVLMKRYFRIGKAGSSQFPGDSFKDITTFEILNFQTVASIPDHWFSRDSLGEDRNWTEMPISY